MLLEVKCIREDTSIGGNPKNSIWLIISLIILPPTLAISLREDMEFSPHFIAYYRGLSHIERQIRICSSCRLCLTSSTCRKSAKSQKSTCGACCQRLAAVLGCMSACRSLPFLSSVNLASAFVASSNTKRFRGVYQPTRSFVRLCPDSHDCALEI